ncbi:MAG: acetylornithine/succinylornithine family transaminase [Planctomycetes bacterium]|nr:acetylornithine/succinylornithine family transaminase [Planctomycetota bacterium]
MDEHVIRTYVRQPEVFVAGNGARLLDVEGREWLDFLGGIAVSALGHGHPRLVEALSDQARKVLHVSNLFRHPYTEEVAGRLARLTELDAVFFTNSGTEANECAMKLARKRQRMLGHPDRTGFVALEGGFHGRTLGSLSLTAGAKYRDPFAPLIPGVTFVGRGDLDALERALRARPAALFVEPIQGEGGIYEHPTAFLQTARRLCDETGTLLVHDEVQCGTGRTGRFLCAQHHGVRPDIVTIAKPLAAGLPMGAVVVAPELRETFVPGDHGSTFAGGPFVTRAALVLLDELENGLLDQVVARGARLDAGLRRIAAERPIVTELRGRGLIRGVRLGRNAPDVQKALFANGLITNCTSGDVIRLLPPYVVTEADVDRALEILDATLAAI